MSRFLLMTLLSVLASIAGLQSKCLGDDSLQSDALEKHAQYNLMLYYKVDCPYCQKVNRFLNQMGIVIPMREVNQDQSYRPALRGMIGRSQVPCLVIDGEPLVESDVIIDWVSEHLVHAIAN